MENTQADHEQLSDEPELEYDSARVVWHVTVSLDGYIAGPDHDLSQLGEFLFAENPVAQEMRERTGAIVAGHTSYQVGLRENRDIFGQGWEGASYLLTHQGAKIEAPAGVNIRYGEIWPVITEAASAAGGQDILIIGAEVARQAMEGHLITEVVVNIAPLLLGSGIRLFDADSSHRLELTSCETHGELITARFAVPRTDDGIFDRSLVHGKDTP